MELLYKLNTSTDHKMTIHTILPCPPSSSSPFPYLSRLAAYKSWPIGPILRIIIWIMCPALDHFEQRLGSPIDNMIVPFELHKIEFAAWVYVFNILPLGKSYVVDCETYFVF